MRHGEQGEFKEASLTRLLHDSEKCLVKSSPARVPLASSGPGPAHWSFLCFLPFSLMSCDTSLSRNTVKMTRG